MVFKWVHLYSNKEDLAIFAARRLSHIPNRDDFIVYENSLLKVTEKWYNLNDDTIHINVHEEKKLTDREAQHERYRNMMQTKEELAEKVKLMRN